MLEFITSLLAAIILLPIIGAVAYYAVKWIKKYFKYVGFQGSFIDYIAICLCILFAAIKVAQFIGTHFAGVQY